MPNNNGSPQDPHVNADTRPDVHSGNDQRRQGGYVGDQLFLELEFEDGWADDLASPRPAKMSGRYEDPPPGYEWVFRPYRFNPVTGRIEFPRGAKVFRWLAPISDKNEKRPGSGR